MSALVTGLILAITEKGISRISKTKVAANVGGLNAFLVLLPGVLEGDPTAIGQLVILIVTWVGVLWGRGNKG